MLTHSAVDVDVNVDVDVDVDDVVVDVTSSHRILQVRGSR